MIVLDAYAVLAYLKDEAAADEVRTLLEDRSALLTTVGGAEVLDHLVRIVGADEDEAALDLAQLGLLDTPSLDSSTAAAAGFLRARHSHRSECAVSLADCITVEVARDLDAPVATSDPHLLDVCDLEGVDVHVLPGPDGSRWSPSR